MQELLNSDATLLAVTFTPWEVKYTGLDHVKSAVCGV